MQFDGAWTIARQAGLPALPPAASWPVLSSGSLAIVPSADASVVPSAGLDSSLCGLGSASGRLVPCPSFCRVRVAVSTGAVSPSPPMADLVQAQGALLSLDMQTGVFSMGCVDVATGCTVKHELRVLLQLPGLALHSVTVAVPSGHGVDPVTGLVTVRLTHEVAAASSASGRAGIRFSGESILPSALSPAAANSATSGTATFLLSAESNGVGVVSAYLPDAPAALSAPAGYNEDGGRSGGRRAWAVLQQSSAPASSGPTTFVLHVLTTTGRTSSGGGINALRRRALAQASSSGGGRAAAAALVAGHEAAWAIRWATHVDVSGAGVDARVVGALRYAFYNVHSCLRPAGAPVLCS